MPTLYLTCGLPGSGKTTLAKRIEEAADALRLTGDEWMHALYPGISTQEAETGPCRGRVEGVQWQIAVRTLRLGCNVVVDWGIWSKNERDHCRAIGRELGVRVVLCVLDPPVDELWKRLARRNAAGLRGNFNISKDALLRWYERFERPTAEELALFDPIEMALAKL